jgi:hypothetical protein
LHLGQSGRPFVISKDELACEENCIFYLDG